MAVAAPDTPHLRLKAAGLISNLLVMGWLFQDSGQWGEGGGGVHYYSELVFNDITAVRTTLNKYWLGIRHLWAPLLIKAQSFNVIPVCRDQLYLTCSHAHRQVD